MPAEFIFRNRCGGGLPLLNDEPALAQAMPADKVVKQYCKRWFRVQDGLAAQPVGPQTIQKDFFRAAETGFLHRGR